eukprot:scaffold568759_cov13-Prasinocladus_malaysianus.AAC.1
MLSANQLEHSLSCRAERCICCRIAITIAHRNPERSVKMNIYSGLVWYATGCLTTCNRIIRISDRDAAGL